jgi:iron complex transport system substrate-binding protein
MRTEEGTTPMRTTTHRLVAALAAGLLLAAGCSSSDEPEEAASAAPLGTVETMFGTVTVPQPEDGELTVVALGWSDAEMALALGVKPVGVFDWQAFGESNKGVGPWATPLFGDVTPTIIANDSQGQLNYEQIHGMSPDLILNTRATADQAVYEQLSSNDTPTVYAPTGTPDFATTWDVQMRSVAAALGKVAEGEAAIKSVEDKISAAASANPEFKDHTMVSGTKFGEAYGAYLAGDVRFDLLADLGFVQNPPVLEQPASGFYANISAENVSVLDADVTTVLPLGFTLEDTIGDKLLQSLDSVKDDRAIFIDPASEFAGAWSAGSVLSIPQVVDEIVPQLKDAVANL